MNSKPRITYSRSRKADGIVCSKRIIKPIWKNLIDKEHAGKYAGSTIVWQGRKPETTK